MIRHLAVVALSTVLVATFLAAPAAAVTSAPVPDSMAAVGDSITQAASSAGSLGVDAPQNSWSTGTSTTVNSHFLRLRQLNPNLVAHNRSVSGAKVANLPDQMSSVAALAPDPGYLTVLIGGNDLCTDTVAQMTSVVEFQAHFTAAMEAITSGSPGTHVYVVSIPDVYQLWDLFKGNWWARFVWATAGICQSLLANPTSTQSTDVQRRAAVRQRNIDYNAVLADVCAAYASRCHFDGNAAFNTPFTTADVSGDYFHPSVAGQAKLASVSWAAGYAWGPPTPVNEPPTAGFTSDCAALACAFTDTSTDDGSVAAWSWSFGDGTTSTLQHPSHAYASGGTYTVTLTVIDDLGASGTTSGSVAVSEPASSITLAVSGTKVRGTKTAELSWSGASGTSVVIYRDGSILVTTANDGTHTDSLGKGGGTHTYRVCEAGATTCSPEVSVSY